MGIGPMDRRFSMQLLERQLLPAVANHKPPQALVLFGPRSAGKATLVRRAGVTLGATWYNADKRKDVGALNIPSIDDLRNLLLQGDTLVIEEAQRVPDIGRFLKRLVDVNATLAKPVKIYATASRSFELAAGVGESALEYVKSLRLWPLSLEELADAQSWDSVAQNINFHLVYGMYPGICTDPENAREKLLQHCNGVLYRDLWGLGGIRRMGKLAHLLTVLAANIGKVLSYDGIARETGLNKGTVADYVALLEACFIVKVCPSYAKNLPTELKKGKKIYFCDNGIRNALLGRFEPMAAREDAAALWENFVFSERLKYHNDRNDDARICFWKTAAPRSKKLDFVELANGKMIAVECRLSKKELAKPARAFLEAYPECAIHTVTPQDARLLREIA